MKKTNLFKILIWVLSGSVILFAVLIVHVAMVTKPVNYDNNNLQLSRIDFKEPVDSVEAVKIKHFVVNLPGVENAFFNVSDQTLVYGYMTNKQNAGNVFQKLTAFGSYNAERFVPKTSELTSGCPMGKDKDSFIYQLSAQVSKWL